MALLKTQLINMASVTGIATVGIFTCGVTETAGGVGVASTSYIKNIIMHNTGLGTARVSLYMTPNDATTPITDSSNSHKILTLDLASNETTFFESTYPIVMTGSSSIYVDVAVPDEGGTGIGSMVNFIVNGDTDV